jgi:OB-fold nucleic acid binding domain
VNRKRFGAESHLINWNRSNRLAKHAPTGGSPGGAAREEVTLQTHGLDKYGRTLADVHLSATLESRKEQSMEPVRAGLLVVLLMVTTEAWGQVSIESLRSSADSSNLELVTLQGEVHLSRSRQNELGGRCGNTTFTLRDDTGSIEVAIRRSDRLIEPLREGDRVQLTAQIRVFRNRENLPIRICVQATQIQHLGQ